LERSERLRNRDQATIDREIRATERDFDRMDAQDSDADPDD
jgi:hypothetical protein